MTDSKGLERLDVVAALLAYDVPRSDAADAWIRPDGTPCSPEEAGLIGSATHSEWALAEGLSGGPEPVSDPCAPLLAGLLRVATGTDAAGLLRVALRQAFLLPDDSRHSLAREDRAAAFADLYSKLAIPGLDNAARERASALLAALTTGC